MGRGRFCNYKFCKGLNFTRALSTPTVVSIAFTSLNMTMWNTTVFYNYQIRELTKVRRLKMNSYFTYKSHDSTVIYFVYHCQNYRKTKSGIQRLIWNKSLKNYPSWCTFSRQHKIWSFHVVIFQRTFFCSVTFPARFRRRRGFVNSPLTSNTLAILLKQQHSNICELFHQKQA